MKKKYEMKYIISHTVTSKDGKISFISTIVGKEERCQGH